MLLLSPSAGRPGLLCIEDPYDQGAISSPQQLLTALQDAPQTRHTRGKVLHGDVAKVDRLGRGHGDGGKVDGGGRGSLSDGILLLLWRGRKEEKG